MGGVDYIPKSGTLSYGPGVSSQTFMVSTISDQASQGNRTLLLSLANASTAALGPQSTAVLTIVDDDRGGKVQFAAAAYGANAVAAGGTVDLAVKRSGGLASPVTVHYSTSDGTAVAGSDYTDTSGDLTFSSSGTAASTRTLTVPISQAFQGAKTFTVSLSDPAGGVVLGSPTVATVTILGAEPTLAFSSAAYSVKTSQPTARVTVKRSAPLTGTVTVGYATTAGTAVPGTDYTDVSATLTFGPNVSTRSFTVPIVKDPFVDVPKTVQLALSDPIWTAGTASLDSASATATLTITNTNAPPTLEFSQATYAVNEVTPKAVITVKRAGNPAGTVEVGYSAAGGTATSGGVDYTLSSGTLAFAPNQMVQTLPVAIVNDSIDEGTETVNLALSNPTWSGGAALLGSVGNAVLNIIDNEPTVQFSAAGYAVSETAKSVTIGVRRTGNLTGAATVTHAVTGGSAVNGFDYTLSPGPLTFLPGQSSTTFSITLLPDTVADGTRTIDLALSGPSGVALGTPKATIVTIRDNDLAGHVQLASSTYGTTAGASLAVTVKRIAGLASDVRVDYSSTDGTATGDVHFRPLSGTLTFSADSTSQTILVQTLDDGLGDGMAHSFTLGLSNPEGGGSLAEPSSATIWVVNPLASGSFRTTTFRQGSRLFLQNHTPAETIRLGLDTNWGGSIVELSLDGENFVNAHDTGREVQPAFYDGDQAYDNCAGCSGVFGWDPVLGGDKYNHGTPTLSTSLAPTSLYTEAQPLEWNPDDKGGGPSTGVLTDVIVEQTVGSVPGQPRAFKVHYRLTHFGTDRHANSVQEFPAVYTNWAYGRLVAYTGPDPWSNDAVTVIPIPSLSDPFSIFPVSEPWAALVDASGVGLTVYTPSQYPWLHCFFYSVPGSVGPTGDSTNYMTAFSVLTIEPSSTFEGDIYLIAGDYSTAREVVYELNQTSSSPEIFAPWGTLDVPAEGDSLTGPSAFVAGWAFANFARGVQVATIELLVDGTTDGMAAYGLARPDVAAYYHGAPVDSGFSLALDTTKYDNGAHTLSVRVTDTSGNVAVFPVRHFSISN